MRTIINKTIQTLKSYKFWTILSLITWASSLYFLSFTFYNGHTISGLEVLLSGWIGPLMGNFAWFANSFFILSAVLLLHNKNAIKFTIFTIAIALNTITFTSYLVHEGGLTSQLYGYGLGVYFWFLSIFLMLIAAGVQRQYAQNLKNTFLHPASIFGIILCFSLTIATSYLSFSDRKKANANEYQRLSGILFKRTSVCQSKEPDAPAPILNFSGILEIKISNSSSEASYPFNQVHYLLDWGIPTIRIDNIDYFYDPSNETKQLISKAATKPTNAILWISEKTKNNGSDVTLKLTDATNRIVFEHLWGTELKKEFRYCPDYGISPVKNEQPRKVILEGLNLKNVPEPRQPPQAVTSNEGIFEGTMTLGDSAYKEAVKAEMTDKKNPSNNCNESIGWIDPSNSDSPNFESNLRRFRINEYTYYISMLGAFDTVCNDDFVYFSRGYIAKNNWKIYRMTIEKRSLSDFSQTWKKQFSINIENYQISDNELKIISIDEHEDKLLIITKNSATDEEFIIQAPTKKPIN